MEIFWVILILFGILIILSLNGKSSSKSKHRSSSKSKPIANKPAPARPATYQYDEFGPIFSNPKEASIFYSNLMKKNPQNAQCLRSLQILRESLQIALTSKNRETAESRMNLAIDKYYEIKHDYSSKMDQKEWDTVERRYLSDLSEFSTVKYINQAKGYLEHIPSLKTEKSKKKYIDLAKQTINDGLRIPGSNKDLLQQFLKVNEHHMQ